MASATMGVKPSQSSITGISEASYAETLAFQPIQLKTPVYGTGGAPPTAPRTPVKPPSGGYNRVISPQVTSILSEIYGKAEPVAPVIPAAGAGGAAATSGLAAAASIGGSVLAALVILNGDINPAKVLNWIKRQFGIGKSADQLASASVAFGFIDWKADKIAAALKKLSPAQASRLIAEATRLGAGMREGERFGPKDITEGMKTALQSVGLDVNGNNAKTLVSPIQQKKAKPKSIPKPIPNDREQTKRAGLNLKKQPQNTLKKPSYNARQPVPIVTDLPIVNTYKAAGRVAPLLPRILSSGYGNGGAFPNVPKVDFSDFAHSIIEQMENKYGVTRHEIEAHRTPQNTIEQAAQAAAQNKKNAGKAGAEHVAQVDGNKEMGTQEDGVSQIKNHAVELDKQFNALKKGKTIEFSQNGFIQKFEVRYDKKNKIYYLKPSLGVIIKLPEDVYNQFFVKQNFSPAEYRAINNQSFSSDHVKYFNSLPQGETLKIRKGIYTVGVEIRHDEKSISNSNSNFYVKMPTGQVIKLSKDEYELLLQFKDNLLNLVLNRKPDNKLSYKTRFLFMRLNIAEEWLSHDGKSSAEKLMKQYGVTKEQLKIELWNGASSLETSAINAMDGAKDVGKTVVDEHPSNIIKSDNVMMMSVNSTDPVFITRHAFYAGQMLQGKYVIGNYKTYEDLLNRLTQEVKKRKGKPFSTINLLFHGQSSGFVRFGDYTELPLNVIVRDLVRLQLVQREDKLAKKEGGTLEFFSCSAGYAFDMLTSAATKNGVTIKAANYLTTVYGVRTKEEKRLDGASVVKFPKVPGVMTYYPNGAVENAKHKKAKSGEG